MTQHGYGIDIEGTNVKVNIVKADKSPELVKNSDYCNIIAKKSGTIKKITAQNGTAVVKVGDFVQKGEVLIAGYMEGKYTEKRYVHSLGEVYAVICYEESKAMEYNQKIYNFTGREEKRYEITLNNLNIKLYKNLTKFDTYEVQKEENKLKIFGNIYLPITITKITLKEQNVQNKTFTAEEIKKMCEDELSPKIEENIKNKEEIIDKDVQIEEYNETAIVTVKYNVLENIGENQKIE